MLSSPISPVYTRLPRNERSDEQLEADQLTADERAVSAAHAEVEHTNGQLIEAGLALRFEVRAAPPTGRQRPIAPGLRIEFALLDGEGQLVEVSMGMDKPFHGDLAFLPFEAVISHAEQLIEQGLAPTTETFLLALRFYHCAWSHGWSAAQAEEIEHFERSVSSS